MNNFVFVKVSKFSVSKNCFTLLRVTCCSPYLVCGSVFTNLLYHIIVETCPVYHRNGPTQPWSPEFQSNLIFHRCHNYRSRNCSIGLVLKDGGQRFFILKIEITVESLFSKYTLSCPQDEGKVECTCGRIYEYKVANDVYQSDMAWKWNRKIQSLDSGSGKVNLCCFK